MKKVMSELHLALAMFVTAGALFALWLLLDDSYPNSWFALLTKLVLTLNVFVGMAQTVRYSFAHKQAENYVNAFNQQPPSDGEERLTQHMVVLCKLQWLAGEFLTACENQERLKSQLVREEAGKETRQHMELLVALHQAEVKVRVMKEIFRKAQRAAEFFGYKTPKRAKAFANCASIL